MRPTPKRLCLLTLLLASMPLTSSCALLGWGRVVEQTTAASPRVGMPAVAREDCPMTVVGQNPSVADLSAAYNLRGVEIVDCNSRRQLAVDVHDEEHRLEDEHARIRAERNCPWYRFGTCRPESRSTVTPPSTGEDR